MTVFFSSVVTNFVPRFSVDSEDTGGVEDKLALGRFIPIAPIAHLY